MTSVFISYSHDSDTHCEFVLQLANQLRKDGLDCQIDQYINGFPPEGWQRWMENQIEQADFVLLVCTETYLRRYRGQETVGGYGVNFEGVVISQTLYEAYYRNTKFIPLLPENGSFEHIPLPLKQFSVFTVMRDYEALYRVLTQQPKTPAPPLGTKKLLPPITLQDSKVILHDTNISPEASKNLEKLMQSFLEQHTQDLKQKNDHIELLNAELVRLRQAQADALTENAKDIEATPKNPLLEAERKALEVFDFPKAAELRDEYYLQRRAQYREQQTKQQQQMAEEAYIAGQRWHNAPNLAKALERYQEAVEFQPTHHEALLQLIRVAGTLGNTNLALTSVQTLRKQLDSVQDKYWLYLALMEEGDILQALGKNQQAFENYQRTLEQMQTLAKDSPDDLDIQRELSVSFNKHGDLYQAKGDANAALKAFQDSLTIRQQLAQRDPANTEWQRDLSVSFDRIGDLYQAKGDTNAALKSYQDSLAIREKLTKIDPNNVQWQTDLVVSYFKLSQVQPEKAKKLLSDALEILKTLDKDNKLSAEQKEVWLPAIQQALDAISK